MLIQDAKDRVILGMHKINNHTCATYVNNHVGVFSVHCTHHQSMHHVCLSWREVAQACRALNANIAQACGHTLGQLAYLRYADHLEMTQIWDDLIVL